MNHGKSNFILGMMAGGALMAGGILLGGMAQQSGGEASFSKISAQEIVLTDERGRQALVSLHASEHGGMISLLDTSGDEVMTLGVARLIPPDGNEDPDNTDDHPMIGVLDITTSEGQLLFRANGNAYGGSLLLNNIKGRNIVTMVAQKSLNGVIAAHDQGGKPVALIAGTVQGGVFQSQDRRENVLGHMP